MWLICDQIQKLESFRTWLMFSHPSVSCSWCLFCSLTCSRGLTLLLSANRLVNGGPWRGRFQRLWHSLWADGWCKRMSEELYWGCQLPVLHLCYGRLLQPCSLVQYRILYTCMETYIHTNIANVKNSSGNTLKSCNLSIIIVASLYNMRKLYS